jgi:anhydro-N-acetylmuramic acid kinase
MSGTSADGVDAAILETDGENSLRYGPALTVPYEPGLSAQLIAALETARSLATPLPLPAKLRAVERALTHAHAGVVSRLLSEARLKPADIDVIGFHGQTVLHRPQSRLTLQLGDGKMLAEKTGIDVVADFRSADVAAGGQGAPLAPLYHRALCADVSERPVAVVNLGGVANVTWIGAGSQNNILAFDTGPANAPVNDWLRQHTGAPMDEDGSEASSGRVDEERLSRILAHPFFARGVPKSLDRFDFGVDLVNGMTLADGAATLTALCAVAIKAGMRHMPAPPRLWIICGGGRHNKTLMTALAQHLPGVVRRAEDVGWRGDVLEAEAFAYLAVRNLRNLPLSLPSTTGVPLPQRGGVLHVASANWTNRLS